MEVVKYTRCEQFRKDLVEYHSAKKKLGGDSTGDPCRSAWSKDNKGRDSINNPKEEQVAKVNITNRRANTGDNLVT